MRGRGQCSLTMFADLLPAMVDSNNRWPSVWIYDTSIRRPRDLAQGGKELSKTFSRKNVSSRSDSFALCFMGLFTSLMR